MIYKACLICNRIFSTIPSRIKIGKGKFCSGKCSSINQKRQVIIKCKNCGISFSIKKNREKSAKYCSLKCYDKKGKNNSYWGRKHNLETKIKMRKSWTRLINNGFESPHKQKLYKNCVICNKKFKLIKSIFNETKCCSRKCVGKYASSYLLGERAKNWIDGRSFLPYPPNFNKRVKRLIIQRDRKCLYCGQNEDLSVHHIDYNKFNNSESNLITLCLSCNSLANGNRDYWRNYYQFQLKEFYGFSY